MRIILILIACINISLNVCYSQTKDFSLAEKILSNGIFYGQVFEDIILSEVFEDVKEGKYVDVGAFDPTYYSVTKYFYDKNWSGINIEPIDSLHKVFLNERPRDINIKIAVSDKKGYATFYKTSNEQLSTLDKKGLEHTIALSKDVERYQKDPLTVQSYKVKIDNLTHILDRYPLKTINFLKIDVEGGEDKVLKGLNFNKYRPQVIIIEMVEYGNFKDISYKWDYMILENNYCYVMQDGINKYYVANEVKNLLLPKFISMYNKIKALTQEDISILCNKNENCIWFKATCLPMVSLNDDLNKF